jgi:transcriptional regulator with XRE-family HTH domain
VFAIDPIEPAAAAHACENRKPDHGTTIRPGDVFRRRLRETRKLRGLNQRELADMMTAAGHSLDHTQISKIETGAREASWDEIVALAHVLREPVARLVAPYDGEPAVAVTDSYGLGTAEFRNWLLFGDP